MAEAWDTNIDLIAIFLLENKNLDVHNGNNYNIGKVDGGTGVSITRSKGYIMTPPFQNFHIIDWEKEMVWHLIKLNDCKSCYLNWMM